MMKRIVALAACICLMSGVFAQTQQGYVKTIGKSGRPGVALGGVTVRVKGGHNSIVSKSNGRFSIKMNGMKNGDAYSLQQVQKKGYELNDAGTIGRQYAFSTTVPLTISMVSTVQLQADKQRIENNAYAVAEKNYKAKMAKLENQLNENTITAEQYRAALQELQDSFEKYQSLIESLADHYAHTDYDLLDENEAEINTLIENGELEKADSLIHTLFAPIDVLKRNKEALDHLDQTIVDAQGIIDQANTDFIAVLKQQEKDAEYLYQLYTIALAQFDNEKASRYIQTRAQLDTTNVEWQCDAGKFVSDYLADYALSINYYQRGLRQLQVQNGGLSEWLLVVCNNIGLGHANQGDYHKALDSYQKAMDFYASYMSEDIPVIATLLNNIGQVYLQLGDYSNALENHRRALEIREQIWGTDNHDVAVSYNNIGLVYSGLCEYNKAIECYLKALNIQKKVMDGFPLEKAAFFHNLGAGYQRIGDYQNTLVCFQNGLEIFEQVLGRSHPSTAKLYEDLGRLFDELGDYQKALDYYQIALNIKERVLGTNHYETAISYTNIGVTYENLGNYTSALEFHFKAMRIQEKALGLNHPLTAVTYNNIGSVYNHQSDYLKALEYCNKALDIQVQSLGENHPDVAVSYNNIGYIYFSSGDLIRANEYFFKALAIQERVLGSDNLNTASLYNSIGLVYSNLGDFVQALEYHQKSLEIRVRQLGYDDSYVAQSYNNVGMDYLLQGEFRKALEYFQKALIKQNPNMAFTYDKIGWCYFNLGDSDNALLNLNISLNLLRKAYGDTNPQVKYQENQISAIEYVIALKKNNLDVFLADHCFIATIIEGDYPAYRQGLTGDYILLEFADWYQNSSISLFDKNEELSGKPKDIVILRDNVISMHHFDNVMGIQFGTKQISKGEREEIDKKYEQWKRENKN